MKHGAPVEKNNGAWYDKFLKIENLQYLPIVVLAAIGAASVIQHIHELPTLFNKGSGEVHKLVTALYDYSHGTSFGDTAVAQDNSSYETAKRLGFYDATMTNEINSQLIGENGYEKLNADGSVTRYELVRDSHNNIVDRKLVEGGERGTGPWIDQKDQWHTDRDSRPNGGVSQEAYERSTAERITRGEHVYEPPTDKKPDPKVNTEIRAKVTHITGPLKNDNLPNSIVLTTLNSLEHPILGNDGIDATPAIGEKGGFTDPRGQQWELWEKKDGKIYFRALPNGTERDYPSVDIHGHWSNLGK